MLSTLPAFASLADSHLLATVKRLAQRERDATAALVASLVELDARRLYLGEGSSSLFVYCTRVLRLSEHAAYHRITAARAARRFPTILERLADGSLTRTNIALLAPHLTPANHVAVLDGARHKSKREVEQQVATLDYPGHFEVRLVSRNSGIRWKKHWVCVTHTLAGEYVGLEEVDDGLWDVYFGPVKLGRMDERRLQIEDHKGRYRRKNTRNMSPMSPD